jgi:hypothetical protein
MRNITAYQWRKTHDTNRQRGFKFVGSTICYAQMQATGMVNDHTLDCFRREEIVAGYAEIRLNQAE